MAYIDPAIRPQFDSMPPHLREHILNMGVRLETMADLMGCLERIIAEEGTPQQIFEQPQNERTRAFLKRVR